jgi:hypothetical protein
LMVRGTPGEVQKWIASVWVVRGER